MQNNKEKKNVFEIENLSFAYDKHEVLNNLNLSFHEGIVTTMIGPNGCGKSTLLQLMTKNLKPAGERFYYRERILHKSGRSSLHSRLPWYISIIRRRRI